MRTIKKQSAKKSTIQSRCRAVRESWTESDRAIRQLCAKIATPAYDSNAGRSIGSIDSV